MQRNHNFYRTSPSSAKGFTLIELLVVISIISLLIAILLPALGSARKSARTIQCANNFRQMGYAQMGYAGDYGWFLSPILESNLYPYNSGWWFMVIRSYAGYKSIKPSGWPDFTGSCNTGILACPEWQKLGSDHWSYAMANFQDMADETRTGTTNFSLAPYKQWHYKNDGTWVPQNRTVRPDSQTLGNTKVNNSRIMLMGELGYTTTHPGNFYTHYAIRNGTYWTGSDGGTFPAFRHNEAKNSLFMDGHVGLNRNDGSMNYYLYLN